MTNENAQLVLKAVTEAFIKSDTTAVERYWSDSYQQHNPVLPDGHPGLHSSSPAS